MAVMEAYISLNKNLKIQYTVVSLIDSPDRQSFVFLRGFLFPVVRTSYLVDCRALFQCNKKGGSWRFKRDVHFVNTAKDKLEYR